jgi:Tol biopolymer transport system component
LPRIRFNSRWRFRVLTFLILALLSLTIRLALPDQFRGWIEPTASAQAIQTTKANGRIVFSSSRENNASEVYVMNSDGSEQTNLTNSQGEDFAPDWSPDGTKIAFVSLRGGLGQKIYVMKADGSAPTRITNSTDSRDTDSSPRWSPDGTKIVFSRNTYTGVSGIYVVNANGTGLKNLTGNAPDGAPVWSPDGTKIAFTSYLESGNYKIYVMNADGSSRTKLTGNPATDTSPAWSPDGTKIVFSSNRDGQSNYEIYVMNADGGNPTRLTSNHDNNDQAPTWSPDGTKILFTHSESGPFNREVYVMNTDGTNQRNLTNIAFEDNSPDWQALPANPAGYVQFATFRQSYVEDIGTVTLTVTRIGGSTGEITVDYATGGGTATEGANADYMAASGTLTFADGETTKTIDIQILNDGSNGEGPETFNVTLSNPTGGSGLGSPVKAEVYLLDNSYQPRLTVYSLSVPEGNAGTTDAVVTVSLSVATGRTITVDYNTNGDLAYANEDFQPVSGTLTFNPGETAHTVTVPIFGDTLNEADETFFVHLSNPMGGAALAVSSNPPAVFINNDDPQPSLSINDVTLTEGDSGATNAVFTVKLSAVSGQTVYVSYNTIPDTASSPEDYKDKSGLLTFNPGQTTLTIIVPVVGEKSFEGTETFMVGLYDAANAALADEQGVCTILNNDVRPTISINDAKLIEGNSGSTILHAVVKLSAPSSEQVSVSFATVKSTATGSNVDYGDTFGGLLFTPGQIAQNIDVRIIGDTMDENDETFFINLSQPTGARIADGRGVFTIVDNDAPPRLSINDVSITERDTSAINATFTVKLTAASGKVVTVNYATANGTAAAGSDYTSKSGTLTIPAGRTSLTIIVPVTGDNAVEANETFFINLSGPTNATILDAKGVGTIINDD